LWFRAVAKNKVSARAGVAGGKEKAGEKKASQAGNSPAERHYGLAGAGAGSALLEVGWGVEGVGVTAPFVGVTVFEVVAVSGATGFDSSSWSFALQAWR